LGVERLLVNLTEFAAPDFDLKMTLDSGQVFHWEKIGNGFVGTIGDVAAYVEEEKQCFESSIWRDALQVAAATATQADRALFCARSSAPGDQRLVSERSDYECGARFLSRAADHSAAEMGVSGYIHLFIDEAGGAHSADFAGASESLR